MPVLLDLDGEVAVRYAPAGVLPDLPRDQVPIASNLIIDREGRIQFYTLLDSANFDAPGWWPSQPASTSCWPGNEHTQEERSELRAGR